MVVVTVCEDMGVLVCLFDVLGGSDCLCGGDWDGLVSVVLFLLPDGLGGACRDCVWDLLAGLVGLGVWNALRNLVRDLL